jgi:hypothetical protein
MDQTQQWVQLMQGLDALVKNQQPTDFLALRRCEEQLQAQLTATLSGLNRSAPVQGTNWQRLIHVNQVGAAIQQ